MKAVTQHSKETGKLINRFDSITQAARELDIYRTAINNNVNNRAKSAGGFVFRYDPQLQLN